MKRKLLFLMVLLVSSTMTWAYDHQDGQGVQYTKMETTDPFIKKVYVSGQSGASGAIDIPAFVTISGENYDVEYIGEGVFSGCTGLTSVNISYRVERIERNAFKGCTGLTFITFGSNMTSIGEGAFSDCTGLATIIIPSDVTSIGRDAFKGCTNCTDVFCHANPDNLTWEDGNCDDFKGNKETRFHVLDYYADAYRARWSTGSTGEGGTDVNVNFMGNLSCGNGLTWSIKNRVLTISKTGSGNGAMKDFDLYDVHSPWYDSRIDDCYSSVVIESGVTSIGNCAFHYRQKFTSITIPENVTSIGEYAFFGSIALESINIPRSVTTIKKEAFMACGKISKVYITDLAAWLGISLSNDNSNPLNDAPHLYLNNEEITNLVIPEGVTNIRDYAFYHCSEFTSVTIPNSVKTIGKAAFKGCNNASLTSITIPEGVTNIGEDAFYGCTGFNSINIPSGVTTISKGAFYGCTGFNSITIPNNVTTIGAYAFNGCTGLGSITFAENSKLTNIENYAFQGCTSLGSINFPASVTTIGGWAFNGCTGLGSITIPEGVTTIGNDAFYGCTGLDGTLTIPASVKNIGGAAFKGCTGLDHLTFAEGIQLESIGECAFENCTSLGQHETTIIPAANIGYEAFYNCSNLTEVLFTSSVRRIGDDAFWECRNLKYVSIDEGVERIGGSAFKTCAIENLVLPFTLTYLGTAAFDSNNVLENVRFCGPSTGIPVPFSPFTNCPKLTKITVPVGCRDTYSELLPNHSSLITETDMYSFGRTLEGFLWCAIDEDENGIYETLEIKNLTEGVERSIPDYASGRTHWTGIVNNITTIDITGNVAAIGNNAFRGCTRLTTVGIPNTVRRIGENAFRGCTRFPSVTIPSSVRSIEANAFSENPDLMSVVFVGASLQNPDANAFDNCKSTISIWVPKNAVTTYQGYWPAYSSKIRGYDALCGDPSVNGGGDVVWTLKDNVLTIGGHGKMKDYDNEENKAPWYENRASITSVVIENGVKGIGSYAFEGFSNASLTSVTIPQSMTSIGNNAFNGCSHLANVSCLALTAPTLGENVFSNCSGSLKVVTPRNASGYDQGKWAELEKTDDIIYTTGDCIAVLDGSVLTVRGIGRMAGGCPWGDNVTSLVIEDGVTYLADYTFGNCTKLTSVTIANSVEAIAEGAFSGCKNLSSITIGNGVKKIGYNALRTFGYKLTSITIPASVTLIDGQAFQSNPGLTTFISLPTTPPTMDRQAFERGNLTDIFVPTSSVDAYKEAPFWSEFADLIKGFGDYCGDGVIWHLDGTELVIAYTGTGTGAMQNYGTTGPWGTAVTSVEISEGVTRIGDNAFKDCADLTSIIASPKVAPVLGTDAFTGYTNTPTVYITPDATGYDAGGWGVFTKQNLNNIWITGDCLAKLKDGTLTISGFGAMADYTAEAPAPWGTAITSVVIIEGVTHIGSRAFYNCGSLSSVEFPGTMSSIGEDAFCNCSNITDVYSYVNAVGLSWIEKVNPDFKANEATRCHVPSQYYDGYIYQFRDYYYEEDVRKDKVNVTFVGDLLNISTNNIAEGTFAGNWTTYYNTRTNVQAPEGVTVYIAKLSGSSLTLKEVSDRIVNAGEGVVLKKETEGAIEMTLAVTTSSEAYTDNALRGVDVQTTISTSEWANKVIYTLASNDGDLGFYKYYDNVSAEKFISNTTLAAKKVFLALNAEVAASARGFVFQFEDGETTGVNEEFLDEPSGKAERRMKNEEFAPAVYYNLNGQKVEKPTKGLYIKNGKKVLFR